MNDVINHALFCLIIYLKLYQQLMPVTVLYEWAGIWAPYYYADIITHTIPIVSQHDISRSTNCSYIEKYLFDPKMSILLNISSM